MQKRNFVRPSSESSFLLDLLILKQIYFFKKIQALEDTRYLSSNSFKISSSLEFFNLENEINNNLSESSK